MTELVSPCCGKPVIVVSEHGRDLIDVDWRNHWYECSACGKPCDPVHPADAHVAEVQKSREEWEKR